MGTDLLSLNSFELAAADASAFNSTVDFASDHRHQRQKSGTALGPVYTCMLKLELV